VSIGFTMAKELFPLEIAGIAVGTVNLFPFRGIYPYEDMPVAANLTCA